MPGKKLKKSNNKQKVAVNKKGSSPVKLALLALIFLISLILFAKTLDFLSKLNKPIIQDLLVSRQYRWDNKSSINLVVKSDSVSVLNYDPGEERVTILKIPDNTYMELPKGFGSWKIGSIFELGEAESPPVGAELLKQSLSKLLGLPVEGFLIYEQKEGETAISIENEVEAFRKNPLSIFSFVHNAKSDLTPLELYKLSFALRSVRSDKITTLDLYQTDITESKLLGDSSRVLGVNNVKLDLFIREKLADSNIFKEGLSVGVFNATSHPGLAQDASRIVANLGGNVIFATNTEESLDKTIVISSEESVTAKRLSEVFAYHCLKSKCQTTDQKVLNSRAPINIVIGEDYYKDRFER